MCHYFHVAMIENFHTFDFCFFFLYRLQNLLRAASLLYKIISYMYEGLCHVYVYYFNLLIRNYEKTTNLENPASSAQKCFIKSRCGFMF